MKHFFILVVSFFFIYGNTNSQNIIKKGKDYIFGDRIVVKFKDYTDANTILNKSSVSGFLKSFGVTSVEKRFKLRQRIEKNSGRELEKIMTVKYSSPVNPVYFARKISHLAGVEWAEPYYLGQLMYTPNDPSYSSQWALRKIKAAEAWDVTKGDTSIVLAIVDTGVDWDHPDLAQNIWTNSGEIPNNGVDDDGNGYVDDVHGWDFGGLSGTPDNNPMEDRPDHGTHVAGIASAVTDNGVGIASIGFSCKIMPVKTSQDNIRDSYGNPLIAYGYQGIIYAVDNGAKVVNTSWGSYSYSNTGQAVVDYAVQHGTLLVGAAGNETNPQSIYPGAYKGALSVGAVDSSDVVAYFSNYGKRLDVLAPGVQILSTWQDDTYTSTLSGTSMASPFVVGLAGLVASRFPTYTPEQIAQQVRVTADNIDDKNASKFNYLLGNGRINAYKAVTVENAKAVRSVSVTFVDKGDGDGVFEKGEKVAVHATFKNILVPTTSLQIQLVAMSEYAVMQNGTFSAGAIGTLTEFDNSSNEFTFTIADNTPENYELSFLLKYSDSDYEDFEWVSTIVNPTYMTQSGNNIAMTFTSKGTMAFNDYPDNTQVDGFKYKESGNLLFEGALIYGTGVKKIDNAARNSTGEKQDQDFTSSRPFSVSVPGSIADEQGTTTFNDFHTFGTRLNISTTMNTYSFADDDKANFIIVEYVFNNTTSDDINGFRMGIFMDWDMDEGTYDDNVVAFDNEGGFGYAYSYSKTNTDAYVTCALVSSEGSYSFYAIQNDGNDGGINIYDGFSDEEKWGTLTNGTTKNSAGPQDISFVAGAGAFTIPANGKIKVAFAIAATESVEELRQAVATAKAVYDSTITSVKETYPGEVPVKFELSQNYPNPFNPSTKINFSIPQNGFATLKVYDSIGKEVATLVNKELKKGCYNVTFNASNLASGIYFYRLNVNNFSAVRKMILLK